MSDLQRVKQFLNFTRCWMRGGGYRPLKLELLVTSRCNARCLMCNVWRLVPDNPSILRRELTLKAIADLISEAREMGTRTVTLSGGEPLLRSDIVEIVRLIKRADMKVQIFTNGTRLTKPELTKALVEAKPDLLAVSLDSADTRFHDEIRGVQGFGDLTIEGLKQLASEKRRQRQSGPVVKVFTLVCRKNIADAAKLAEIKADLGVEQIIFNPLINKVPGKLADYVLSDEDVITAKNNGINMGTMNKRAYYQDNLCFTPWHQITIDPFGNVYPCCFATPFQNLGEDLSHAYWGKSNFLMGNVTEDKLASIWNGAAFTAFRKTLKKAPPHGMCKQCNQPAVKPWADLQAVYKGLGYLPAPGGKRSA